MERRHDQNRYDRDQDRDREHRRHRSRSNKSFKSHKSGKNRSHKSHKSERKHKKNSKSPRKYEEHHRPLENPEDFELKPRDLNRQVSSLIKALPDSKQPEEQKRISEQKALPQPQTPKVIEPIQKVETPKVLQEPVKIVAPSPAELPKEEQKISEQPKSKISEKRPFDHFRQQIDRVENQFAKLYADKDRRGESTEENPLIMQITKKLNQLLDQGHSINSLQMIYHDLLEIKDHSSELHMTSFRITEAVTQQKLDAESIMFRMVASFLHAQALFYEKIIGFLDKQKWYQKNVGKFEEDLYFESPATLSQLQNYLVAVSQNLRAQTHDEQLPKKVCEQHLRDIENDLILLKWFNISLRKFEISSLLAQSSENQVWARLIPSQQDIILQMQESMEKFEMLQTTPKIEFKEIHSQLLKRNVIIDVVIQ